jgi:DNA replicative helicase MCM subunit Mcm2 (Cdc46/Mcm family)
VRLQELDEKEKGSGRVPRTIDIELFEDLCDTCVPGDVITVTGVVKASYLFLLSDIRLCVIHAVFPSVFDANEIRSMHF